MLYFSALWQQTSGENCATNMQKSNTLEKQIKVTPFKGLCSSPSMCPHSPLPFIHEHLPRMILHFKKILKFQVLWCDVSHMNGLKSFVSSTKETDGILSS